MTTRVTEGELRALVNTLNNITGEPQESYTRNEKGNLKSNVGNYHLSFAYSGVTLHQMVNDGGGVTTPLGGGYFTKRELAAKLCAFIAGILLAKHG